MAGWQMQGCGGYKYISVDRKVASALNEHNVQRTLREFSTVTLRPERERVYDYVFISSATLHLPARQDLYPPPRNCHLLFW